MARARLVGWITLFACLAPRGAAAAPPEAPQGHVLLITIDGLPATMLDDPAASLPTLRALAEQGAVAEGIRPSNPTVTWPNHTTLITGVRADKHSLFFNGVLERPGVGRPVRVNMLVDQARLIAVPTLFEAAKKTGLRTAAINWPCTRNGPSVDDNFPDVPDQIEVMTPALRERLVAAGYLSASGTTQSFRSAGMVRRDEIWTAAMCRVIADSKPALMTFHLLTVDALHHAHGPATAPGYAAMALADSHVAKVLAALDAAGIRDKTTVIVTADHGFAAAKKLILPNVAFRKAKLLTAGTTAPVAARAQSLSAGGTAMIYLTDPATADEDRKQVVELLKATDGVADVYEPARYSEINLPDPAKNRQAPDLVVTAKDGYAFDNYATGDDVVIDAIPNRHKLGHHGYLAADPRMNAVFIAAGRGVKSGQKLGVIDNVDVAPTIAKLLGLELPAVDGKVIADLLSEQK